MLLAALVAPPGGIIKQYYTLVMPTGESDYNAINE